MNRNESANGPIKPPSSLSRWNQRENYRNQRPPSEIGPEIPRNRRLPPKSVRKFLGTDAFPLELAFSRQKTGSRTGSEFLNSVC